MKSNFHIFAVAALGEGLSGSDRIFIEFARRWSMEHRVNIYVWEEGYTMCLRQKLKGSGISYQVLNMEPWQKMGFIINYFARIVGSVTKALFLKLENSPETIIYSASEFWMDSLPAFIIKKRFPKTVWVASWFQTAPNPFQGFSLGKRKEVYRLSAFYYWLMQLSVKPLISRFPDIVLVNNELEIKQFPKQNKQKKVQVVLGAVNLADIKSWREKNKNLDKVYDAVFQGRFHPQKGVIELIDIWKKVVLKIPSTKLALIGDGPLMDNVKLKIKKEKLEKNVKLFGWVFDGPKKYKIFSQSKIVTHPSFYDSGGMAAAEAMAFGLPCVGFDLKSYRSYYPKGMVKADIGDLDDFTNQIVKLLNDKKYRQKVGREGLEMIEINWSWDKRAEQVLSLVTRND